VVSFFWEGIYFGNLCSPNTMHSNKINLLPTTPVLLLGVPKVGVIEGDKRGAEPVP
jgi:hypothetical protein